MLESAAERLGRRGGPHFGSPDKQPQRRLDCIAAAGELAVPFTSGILIGIGETRRERIEALLALRELHERYGHIQEIIIQNFRAKPGTRPPPPQQPLPLSLAPFPGRGDALKRLYSSPSPRLRGEGRGEGQLQQILDRACAGESLAETDIVRLFEARGDEFDMVCAAA